MRDDRQRLLGILEALNVEHRTSGSRGACSQSIPR